MIAPRSRAGHSMLGGVQDRYDRDAVDDMADEREASAAARAGIPLDRLDAVRDAVLADLPDTGWSPVPPAPIE
ncbi:MAG: hypothetical protein R3F59_34575 [Myxococcota bacterium]